MNTLSTGRKIAPENILVHTCAERVKSRCEGQKILLYNLRIKIHRNSVHVLQHRMVLYRALRAPLRESATTAM